ncbi:MAG: sensor domain-containing diguanylate cyclase [Rhodocyclaceae bacterium]|nr:sensor domain-containing diguanylate cyclase [Rhodocyclaceae bacterium]
MSILLSDRLWSFQQTVLFARLVAMLVFLAAGAITELGLGLQRQELDADTRLDAIAYGSGLRARVDRELNTIIYLSSGLSAYLATRHNTLDRVEIQSILGELHKNSGLIRNLGIAVGEVLTYVHPERGNEKAIGLNYRRHPQQWPAVEQVIRSRKGALAGPVNLVQGGSGLIYRSPVLVKGEYWGLLSTVIDTDLLFQAAFREMTDKRFEFAIRNGAAGLGGQVIYGRAELFDDPACIQLSAEVPSGNWIYGIRPVHTGGGGMLWILRILGWTVATLIGVATFMFLRHRVEMAQLALADSLTGLPNRRLFDDRIHLTLERAKRIPEGRCGLLFIDLDGFKDINDIYGHRMGDHLLQVIAGRLRQVVRTSDTLARWGGDEFVLLVEESSDEPLANLVSRLRQAVEEPIYVGDLTLTVGASIGLSRFPEDGDTAHRLIMAADQDMYADKAVRKAESAR